MSRSKPLRVALVMVATLSVAAAAYALAADDEKKDAKDDAKQAAASVPADQAKEMEAWMALAKPGKEHAAMKRMEGEFDVETEMVMQPGAQPMKSKGKQKAVMIMGGRYLHADYTGESMGMTFHGASLSGYDNAKKKHFGAWIDDMSTGIMLAEGTASPDGKVVTLSGAYDDPMTHAKRAYRWVTTFASEDKYTFDWFDADKDGKNEFRMMHNTYTRVK